MKNQLTTIWQSNWQMYAEFLEPWPMNRHELPIDKSLTKYFRDRESDCNLVKSGLPPFELMLHS